MHNQPTLVSRGQGFHAAVSAISGALGYSAAEYALASGARFADWAQLALLEYEAGLPESQRYSTGEAVTVNAPPISGMPTVVAPCGR